MTTAYEDTLAWLYGVERRAGVDLALDRVRDAAATLGHPELAVPVFHVGGTNGKGSTAAMLAAILRADGRRVGLFTSPHLVSFRERIVIDALPVAADQVVRGVARLRDVLGADPTLTCFEVITLLGFMLFAQARVDVAVVEVGLGGRLDATNIVAPVVSVITNVTLDHTEYLGTDLASVAKEKAGIIKPAVPVVSAADHDAAQVLQRAADVAGSRLDLLGRDFHVVSHADGRCDYRSPDRCLDGLAPALLGMHQHRNAALAIRALDHGGSFGCSPEAVARGLAAVTWPGRMQVVRDLPLVILDGAHNPAAIDVLVREIRRLSTGRRVRVLFGVMRDKPWQGMMRTIEELATDLTMTRPSQPRSANPAELVAVAQRPARARPDPGEALRELIAESAADDVILVTGSLFLVGDVLAAIEAAAADEVAIERAALARAGRT